LTCLPTADSCRAAATEIVSIALLPQNVEKGVFASIRADVVQA
jgi:hypothetical protein